MFEDRRLGEYYQAWDYLFVVPSFSEAAGSPGSPQGSLPFVCDASAGPRGPSPPLIEAFSAFGVTRRPSSRFHPIARRSPPTAFASREPHRPPAFIPNRRRLD